MGPYFYFLSACYSLVPRILRNKGFEKEEPDFFTNNNHQLAVWYCNGSGAAFFCTVQGL